MIQAPERESQQESDRRELLELLLSRGILYGTDDEPIVSRDGTTHRWIMNPLAVSLTTRGAELFGRCLLPLLERFDGTQLATYGTTAIPILQSIILASGGRYTG